jgi:hypothetical protein
MRLEGELAEKDVAYSRKVTEIEGFALNLKTQSDNKQNELRSEILMLSNLNEERVKVID